MYTRQPRHTRQQSRFAIAHCQPDPSRSGCSRKPRPSLPSPARRRRQQPPLPPPSGATRAADRTRPLEAPLPSKPSITLRLCRRQNLTPTRPWFSGSQSSLLNVRGVVPLHQIVCSRRECPSGKRGSNARSSPSAVSRRGGWPVVRVHHYAGTRRTCLIREMPGGTSPAPHCHSSRNHQTP